MKSRDYYKAKFLNNRDNDDEDDIDDIEETFFKNKKSKSIVSNAALPITVDATISGVSNPSNSSTSMHVLNESASLDIVDEDLIDSFIQPGSVMLKEAQELLKSVEARKRKYETKSTPLVVPDLDDGKDEIFNFQIPSVKKASERRTAVTLPTVSSSTVATSSSSSLNLKRLKLKTRLGKACLSWLFPTTFSFNQVTSSLLVLIHYNIAKLILIVNYIYDIVAKVFSCVVNQCIRL